MFSSDPSAVRAGGARDGARVARQRRRHRAPARRMATPVPAGAGLWRCRGTYNVFLNKKSRYLG